jgi:hypothetical protein
VRGQGQSNGTRNVNANGLSNLRTLRQLLVALPLLAFAACQSAPGSVQVVNESAPVAATSTEQVPKPSPSIAILVSRNLPVYTDVATQLDRLLAAPHRVYPLDGRDASDIARQIQQEARTTVVAIGPGALNAAQNIAGVDVIYAQVVSPSIVATRLFRGVDAIPPFTLQLSQWLSLAPDTKTIGVVAGESMRSHIGRLQEAADASGLALVVHEVSSDKEALFRFRQMLAQIDGAILLPDEAVLSPAVIEQMLDYSRQQHKEVVVYSDALFALGAFMLVAPVAEDIAHQVVQLLDAPVSKTPRVVQLTAMTTVVRPIAP